MIFCGQKKNSARLRGAIALAQVRVIHGSTTGLGILSISEVSRSSVPVTVRNARAARKRSIGSTAAPPRLKIKKIISSPALQAAGPFCTTIVLPGRFDFVAALAAM
jgi:hypothetical protein